MAETTTAVPFGTLTFARRLEDAGLSAPVAAGASEALTSAELATKSDVARLGIELRSEMELLCRDLTIRMGSIMVVGVGVLLAAVRYLLPHP